jgi:hypothetical protein
MDGNHHQGNSSATAALIDAVNKHNRARRAEPAMLFPELFGCGPSLTNENATSGASSYDADMRLAALMVLAADKSRPASTSWWDYSFGQAVAVKVNMNHRHAPDITIVGMNCTRWAV